MDIARPPRIDVRPLATVPRRHTGPATTHRRLSPKRTLHVDIEPPPRLPQERSHPDLSQQCSSKTSTPKSATSPTSPTTPTSPIANGDVATAVPKQAPNGCAKVPNGNSVHSCNHESEPLHASVTSLDNGVQNGYAVNSGNNGYSHYGAFKDMEGGKRETVVQSYDFGDDPTPPDHCCCGRVPIQRGCKIVAVLCLFSAIANVVLYCFGFSRLGLNNYLEVMLLIFEFLSLFFLCCGLSRERSGLLKPYLFFNTIWVFCLSILFIMCMWHIMRGGNLSQNLIRNIKALKGTPEFSRSRHQNGQDESTAITGLVTAAAMVALALLIIIDFCMVRVVYRGFQFFAYKEDKAKDDSRGRSPVHT